MRVAVLGIKQLPAQAGADRVVERLLQHESGRHEFTVYLLRGAGEPLACTPRRRYVYVPAVGGKHLRALSYFFLCCVHVLFRGSYDVAHVHNSDFGLVAPLLKLKRGLRIVGTFHGNPYERGKWGRGARAVLRLSEALFVRTCDVLTSVAASKRVAGRDVRYIPNGLDAAPPSSNGNGFAYEAYGLQPGGFLLFACGRLDRTKGLHHLLEAYRGLPDAPPLLVIGEFSHDRAYAREIEEQVAGMPGVVLFKQLLPRDTLLEVVRDCSVFVFPSEVEAMSMMLLEAIGVGAVVVCSDIPENIEVVGTEYALLFRSGDPGSLRATLERALSAPRADPIARVLTDRVDSAFRWDRIVPRYEHLYEGV